MNTNHFQIQFQVTPASSSTIPVATTAPVVTTAPVTTTTTLVGSTVAGATAQPTTLGATTLAPITSSTLIQLNPTASTTTAGVTGAAVTTVASQTTIAAQPGLPTTETQAAVSPVAEAGTGELAFTGASLDAALFGFAFIFAGIALSLGARKNRRRA
jgi:hypothetical protein